MRTSDGDPAERPIIGLTSDRQVARTGSWDLEAAFLPAVYVDTITRAGGTALLLPPQHPASDATVADLVGRLDGVLITAGVDVDPERYGAARHEMTEPSNTLRDAWEDAILSAAIAQDVPFLGICRGLQVLNVNRGGTLLQHLPDVVGDDRYYKGNGEYSINRVAIYGGALRRLLSDDSEIDVKSYHHQAVEDVGAGLTVTARSGDGTIQAIELDSSPFGLAVQWHPEQDSVEDSRLFTGLVAAARQRAVARTREPISGFTRYPLPI